MDFKYRFNKSVWPDFGDFAVIEMKRHGAPNEMFYHKVIGAHESNGYVDVPVQQPPTNKWHEETVPVARVVCCGLIEDRSYVVRVEDLKYVEIVLDNLLPLS